MALDQVSSNHVLYQETQSKLKETGTETGLGQDAFMKMFLAQMTNQNPLNPMDNTEFTAQLAQFSSLEKLTLIANSMEGLGRLEEAYAKTQALSYLGREVTVSGGVMPVLSGYSNSVLFEVDNTAYVFMRITAPNGSIVANRDLGAKAPGIVHEVTWDGLDESGKPVADGAYRVSLYAYDANGNALAVKNQQVTGIVTGYETVGNSSYLLLGDAALPIDKIINVRLPRVVYDNPPAITDPPGGGSDGEIGGDG